MIEIIEELGNYDVFLYLTYYINSKLEALGEKIICEIFDIMRHLAINDKKQSCLRWMYSSSKGEDKELMGFAHFLRLLFHEGCNSTELLQKHILPFIFYF